MLMALDGVTLGNYRVLGRLGQGEHTTVYRARQLSLSRDVTLKVLNSATPEALASLGREAQIVAHFQHHGVRQVYGIETFNGITFVVLEYMEYSLNGLIEQRRQNGAVFALAETVRLLRPVAAVLDYLHSQRWCHLDIKPHNILVSAKGRVVLADFGTAQAFGKPESHGTPAYVSPEVVQGQTVSATSDVYSLGIVAFEMLSGRLPFGGDNAYALMRQQVQVPAPMLDQANPRCHNNVAWIVKGAMAKPPRMRYESAGVFLEKLASGDRFTSSLSSLPRRRPLATTLAGGTALAALAVGLTLPQLIRQQPMTAPVTPTVSLPAAATVIPPSATTLAVPTSKGAGTPAAATSTGATVTAMLTSTPAVTSPAATIAASVAPGRAAASPIAPTACTNPDAAQNASLVAPAANSVLARGALLVWGTADLPGTTGYEFQLCDSAIGDCHVLAGYSGSRPGVSDLGAWDNSQLPSGSYVFRLRVKQLNGQHQDCDVPIRLP